DDMTHLEERSRRRDEWVEGEWVHLGRFGEWSFPRPNQVLIPAPGGRRPPRMAVEYYVGSVPVPGYARLLTRAAEAKPGQDFAHAVLALAAALLRANYRLDEDELESLVHACIGNVIEFEKILIVA